MNPYLDIILRSASVYLFMLIALRIFGKKELSQLNTADVILILLISNSVQNAMVGSDTSLLGGLGAAAILFVINFSLKKLMFKFPKFSDFLHEKPEILIHDGKLDFKSLGKLGTFIIAQTIVFQQNRCYIRRNKPRNCSKRVKNGVLL